MDIKLAVWNIRGMNNSAKQNEAIKLMRNGKLQVCTFIETHLKLNTIQKAGNKFFGSWEWVSNVQITPTCYRILTRWNPNTVNLMVIDSSKQSLLCSIEVFSSRINFFCSFIYASNNGSERKSLWRELGLQKQFVGNSPWVLMGDFNVTLDMNEHSSGGSYRTIEMQDFQDAVNFLEIEDIRSTGFNFTWTKSLKNSKCSVLKKLDGIMFNEEFQKCFQAHGEFLPYSVYDHSPAELIILGGHGKKARSFRFSNFVADKEEFKEIVSTEWDDGIHAYHIYKLTQNLKKLKKPLNELSWSYGNIFEKVNELKEKLSKAQEAVDKDPHNEDFRVESANALNMYMEAANDEVKLLQQKAKIQWMKDGDRNTTYFHGILKARKHKNRVESICDEEGRRFEGQEVAEQFVKHFEQFLGRTDNVVPIMEGIFDKVLKFEGALHMIRPVTDSELKDAMFSIGSNKASGPDGYTSAFFYESMGHYGCKSVFGY
uniref:uncharacterized protein LOC122587599 n=1 Tax=Erigeron canadensis TaxID=72917 RepID=UPI001CB8DCED|nr:uncharacterized protein LOC122587599 [Erigeron canadensis]